MASELSETICDKYFNTGGALLKDVVDESLQEVQEVLKGLVSTAHQHSWAHVAFVVDCACKECCVQRAKELMKRLQLEEK